MKRLFLSTLTLCAMALALPGASAAVFCVGDAATLATALNIADNNGQDDDIRIQQGTIIGNFVYNANVTETGNLALRGGYDATCSVSTGNAADSVIDGGGIARTLLLSGRDNSSLSVSSLTVTGGLGQARGGGLDIDRWVAVDVVGNQIVGNTSVVGQGGTAGVEIDRSATVTVSQNLFSGNDGDKGGALSVSDMTSASITLNRFAGNSAADGGGGLDLTSSGPVVLANNLFSGNSSAQDGGAVSLRVEQDGGVGTLQATNNTFVNNQATQEGGALDLNLDGDATTASLDNNLFWNNTAPLAADMTIDNDDDGNGIASFVGFEHNNFNQTPFLGIFSRFPIAISASNFNLVDPLFVSATDFHLSSGSPMIDAGDATAPEVGSIDLDGMPRVQGASVDIGAFETGVDSDGDGVFDAFDNCTLLANTDQRDTNGDGFGNLCDADLNNDGIVNVVDLGLLRLVFFTANADADFDGDGTVNFLDLGIFRTLFGLPPGPSGMAQ